MTKSTPSSLRRANELARTLPCQVRGCLQHRRGIQAYCNRHQLNLQRYGSPTGRFIKPLETAHYAKLVDRFIKTQGDHPALLASYVALDQMLLDNINYRQPKRLRYDDHASRIALRLRDLLDGGITGRQIFREAATAYLFADTAPHLIDPLSIEFRFFIAKRVLSLVPQHTYNRATGSHGSNQGRFLDPLGRSLLRLLLPVLRGMAENLKGALEADRQRHARMIELLTTNPFKQTTPLPQPRPSSRAQRTTSHD